MHSEAIEAQRELSNEIDALAARYIREHGIPLFEAIELAKRKIQANRYKRVAAGGLGSPSGKD